jgi:DNA-directed RNA polymerase specialized sigma54-like protein
MDQVDRVLEMIARADPPGLATAGPREALIAQLELLGDDDPRIELARRILHEAFAELGRREFGESPNGSRCARKPSAGPLS